MAVSKAVRLSVATTKICRFTKPLMQAVVCEGQRPRSYLGKWSVHVWCGNEAEGVLWGQVPVPSCGSKHADEQGKM